MFESFYHRYLVKPTDASAFLNLLPKSPRYCSLFGYYVTL